MFIATHHVWLETLARTVHLSAGVKMEPSAILSAVCATARQAGREPSVIRNALKVITERTVKIDACVAWMCRRVTESPVSACVPCPASSDRPVPIDVIR